MKDDPAQRMPCFSRLHGAIQKEFLLWGIDSVWNGTTHIETDGRRLQESRLALAFVHGNSEAEALLGGPALFLSTHLYILITGLDGKFRSYYYSAAASFSTAS